MRTLKCLKKNAKGMISVLLVLSVMLSLVVPFNLTAFAEGEGGDPPGQETPQEDPAQGDQPQEETPKQASDKICAMLYKINGSSKDYELVFQNDATADPTRQLVASYTDSFASTEYHNKTYYINSILNPSWNWADNKQVPLPWYGDSSSGNYIKTITFKEEIKPLSIASWFYNCQNVKQINGLENLNTSNCENMSFAFYNFAQNAGTVTSLDLSCLNRGNSSTGNVRMADFFIKSSGIKTLDLSGMDLSGIGRVQENVTPYTGTNQTYYISDLNYFVYSCTALTSVNLDGIDLSHIRQLRYLFAKDTALLSLDFSKIKKGPEDAYTVENLFSELPAVKTITLGSEGHLFEIGTDLTSGMQYAANSSLPAEEIAGKSSRTMTLTYLGSMFNGSKALESMDLSYVRTDNGIQHQYNSVFKDCSSLQTVTGLEYLLEGITYNAGEWGFKEIFRNCSSLKSIDFSSNTRALYSGEYMFANCSALKTLDLSGLGIDLTNTQRQPTHENMKLCYKVSDGNIYQGCEELAEVVFSPYYPQHAGSGFNIPPDKTWVKVEQPSAELQTRYSSIDGGFTGQYSKLYSEDPTTAKTSEQLFGYFQPEYAGRWVAISAIALDGNGGTPDKQLLTNNAKDLPLNYDPAQITTPQRTGFTFVGWFSDKKKALDDPEIEQLPAPNGDPAHFWTYYARWTENTYNLTLDCNAGGTVPDSVTVASLAARTGIDPANISITDDRKQIKFQNILYTQYVELNKSFFASSGGDSILTSWGDRPNGTGREYGVNESVSKLTPADGDTVTLYAQWHTPQAIITFDVNDSPAHPATPVEPITYNDASAPFGELPQSSREGYDFVCWYYETTDPETGVVTRHDVDASTTVEMSRTLYARWMENPKITFSCVENGGTFTDNSNKQTNICHYNRPVGILPTPHNGTAAFKGWYETPTPNETVDPDHPELTDKPITSDTIVKGDKTYYAVWGYQLEVDANGGSFTDDFEGYPIQNEKLMTVTLHPISKPNATFGGWYTTPAFTEGTEVSDGTVLDLSVTNKIYAKWTNDICEVTLDPAGGAVSPNKIKVNKDHTLGELPTPTRERDADGNEYTFLGWYAGETPYTATSQISADVTLTAHWAVRNKKVTFKAEGGTFFDSGNGNDVEMMVTENGTIDCPPGISRTGYFLEGWYTDVNDESTRLKTTTAATPTQIADITVYYAKWVSPTDVITSEDGKISYAVQWVTPTDANVTNTGDDLILHPTTSNTLNTNLRIYFSTKYDSGGIPVGAIKITIPASTSVFKNRDGGNAGVTDNVRNNLFQSEYFNFKQVGTDFVFTNKVVLNTTNTIFNIDYTSSDARIVSGGYIDENGDYQQVGNNTLNLKDFPVVIKKNDELLYEKDLRLEIHTKVDTTDIAKTRSTVIYEWQKEWDGASAVTKPVDLQNYFFIKWNLSANAPATSSQKYSIIWSEDTVHDGTVVYTSGPVVTDNSEILNTNNAYWKNERTSGNSPAAYVITMHRKDEARMNGNWANVKNEVILNVAWRTSDKTTPYIQQYRTSVESNAYVAPDEGEGMRDFTKRIVNYRDEGSHYIRGGQELVQSGDLDELNAKLIYDFAFVEKAPFSEQKLTWNANTKVYHAPERTLTVVDGEKGKSDVRISQKIQGDDWNKWGATGERALTDAEYSFGTLIFNLTEFDVIRLDDNTWSSPFEHTKRSEYGYTDIYVRYEGDDDFRFYKTVQIVSENQQVTLPATAVGFKVVHKSTFAATNLSVRTNLKLKAAGNLTDTVIQDIVNERQTLLKNKARFTESMDGVADFAIDTEHYVNAPERDAFESSYILTVTDSYIYSKKSLGSETTDTNGVVTIPAVVTGWGYNNSGYKKRLKKCVIRDLLPQDYSVDKDTIYVLPVTENYTLSQFPSSTITADNYDIDNANAFHSGYYSVSFEYNKNNSGRTMMVVTVTVPDDIVATGVSVWFRMKTTQSNVLATTTTPINYASFKDLTENQSVPIDKDGKLNAIDPKLVNCFTSYDDDFTAYAAGETSLIKPPISTTAISSIVTADGSTLSKHEHVGLNSPYSYYIYYSNDSYTQVNDLVFYDVLEKTFDENESAWEGVLESVDVNAIKQLTNATNENTYCAPVVYYATTPKDQLSAADFNLTLLNGDPNPIWKNWTDTPPADLSAVTAIAVDCRKDSANEDFVLDKSMYISFYINMKSPTAGDNGSLTFNDATIKAKYYKMHGSEPFSMKTSNDVTLHYPNPRFVKSAIPASGTEEEPNKVVVGSTLEYVLTITNRDEFVPMYNVVVEDVLDGLKVDLKQGNIKIQVGDEEELPIGDSPLIVSSNVTNDIEKTGDVVTKKTTTFTATVASVGPLQTVKLIVPVTVLAEEGTQITNAASIKKVNDVDIPSDKEEFISNETYHVASGVVAKLQKVNMRGEPIENAKLQIQDMNGNPIPLVEVYSDLSRHPLEENFFMSTLAARDFAVAPGKYKLVELASPDALDYKVADPLEFTIDVEGFAHIGKNVVETVQLTDDNTYSILFHENKPGGEEDEKAVVFKNYGPADIKNNDFKIDEFFDIPTCGGDDYEFVGWFYQTDFAASADFDESANNPQEINFSEVYDRRETDYHLYAKWRERTKGYNVIFHENKPGGTAEEKAKIFKEYASSTIVDDGYKIPAFTDVPDCAGDGYTLVGWYYKPNFEASENFDAEQQTAMLDFDTQVFGNRDEDYHLYAVWQAVDYKVIFHENKPGGNEQERKAVFKEYASANIASNGYKIAHFYDIPSWAGDEYVFAGWYYSNDLAEDFAEFAHFDYELDPTAVIFESQAYTPRAHDYHLYAKWIPVGTVDKSFSDGNIYDETLRGFGLAGVQVRPEGLKDSNFNNAVKPGGMRYVTSFSESLYHEIDALSDTNVDNVPVEYGYVVGTGANIDAFISHYNVDASTYRLQYKGQNVNGVNTQTAGNAATDYRYISDVNCTSRKGTGSAVVTNGVVKEDHRNFGQYRLFTLVVYYTEDDGSDQMKGELIEARSYIRYFDANGKLRVFYDIYRASEPYDGSCAYHGGCLCSFDMVNGTP